MFVLAAILGLSLLVIVHEAGHYVAARSFGMRVIRFSIGFGPVLASYRPKHSPTTFQVCAVPFLAYVLIAGMNPAEEVDPDDEDLYPNKGLLARIITIFAGPAANYVAASVMVFFLAALYGWKEPVITEPMIVQQVHDGTPAAGAGLREGDVILEAQGRPIRNVTELIEVTADRAGKPTLYVVERSGKRLEPFTITPEDYGGKGKIGVSAVVGEQLEVMPMAEAAVFAVEYPLYLTVRNLEGIQELIRKKTTEGIAGPVKMTEMIAENAEKGFFDYAWILILISVALGLFNLLPFPALDGGRLVFLGYELVTRRRPNERIEATVHALGILFLLGVIALVTLREVAG